MADNQKYIRKVQTSVTCFLHCGDEYLFVHRSPDKTIDPNRLNGIGGRLEPGENYLAAAIRETKEETGYTVTPLDVRFSGIVKLEGGYDEDWVMCFFKVAVPSKEIPTGSHTKDGKLIWLHHAAVLTSEYELVDDLHYCFKDIVAGSDIFFLTVQVNDKHKIYSHNISKLRLLFER